MKAVAKNLIKIFLISFGIVVAPILLNGQNLIPDPFLNDDDHFIRIKIKYDFIHNQTLFSSSPTLSSHNNFEVKMPNAYSFDNLALFCKIEERVSQKSKLAMRMRLGSLDYVDQLERKPHYNKINN